MTEAAAPLSAERREDAGYMKRLLEETHEDARATRKCLFEGNGEPALVVQMANLKTEHSQQRTDIDQIRKDLDGQMAAMLIVQQTLLTMTAAFSKIGVALLLALVVGIVGVVWGIITHQLPWFQP